MTNAMRALVLWDIDLTLLDLRRIGATWLQDALVEVTGRLPEQIPSFAGRTDRWITAEMLRRLGLAATDELIEQVQTAAVAIAGQRRAAIAASGITLPGAETALRTIAGLPDVAQSLVTGNLAPIAGYKVSAFGLDPYLDLEIGGYGGVSEQRAELVADALRRAAERHGGPFAPQSVFVIGDTPHDIEAARAHGVRAVGVSTGRFSEADLYQSGAHVVLPDLSDTDAVLALLATTESTLD